MLHWNFWASFAFNHVNDSCLGQKEENLLQKNVGKIWKIWKIGKLLLSKMYLHKDDNNVDKDDKDVNNCDSDDDDDDQF